MLKKEGVSPMEIIYTPKNIIGSQMYSNFKKYVMGEPVAPWMEKIFKKFTPEWLEFQEEAIQKSQGTTAPHGTAAPHHKTSLKQYYTGDKNHMGKALNFWNDVKRAWTGIKGSWKEHQIHHGNKWERYP